MSNKKKQQISRTVLSVMVLFLVISSFTITYILKTNYDMRPSPFDLSVQQWFFSLRNDTLNILVSALTHCGDTVTVIILCAVLIIVPNMRKYGIPVSLSALSGVAVYKPMKHIFMRARPDQTLHLVAQGGYSFPSGHSVTSIIVYGLLIYLIRKYCKNDTVKNALTVICAVLMVLIGPSRIYVGVHWPTDVLCGWLIGLCILIFAILILERREKNENLH